MDRAFASGATFQSLSLRGQLRRHGAAVILEAIAEDWRSLDSFVGRLDDDFVQAVNEKPEPQERPVLDNLFD